MPLPPGVAGFSPIGGGNVDFGPLEALSALQRNPQIRRAFGTGVLSITGSVVYAVWPNSGTVTLADATASFLQVAAPGVAFDQGIPTVNPPSGASLTVTPSNLSTVFTTVLYK